LPDELLDVTDPDSASATLTLLEPRENIDDSRCGDRFLSSMVYDLGDAGLEAELLQRRVYQCVCLYSDDRRGAMQS
jgi:hypothetical protein